MEDLVNGRIQCAVASEISAKEAMDKGLPIKTIGRYGQPDDETAYAVRKEDTDLLKMLNEGLTKLMASPYWKELNEKYKVH
jgi:polar amino acid transport system substrate-binding protein